MKRVLVTAFGPYGPWPTNASWLCVEALTRHLPEAPQVTTRLYPVALTEVRARLVKDLDSGFDVAIHLGQAPAATRIRLEAIGLNIAAEPGALGQPLEPGAPLALASDLPLAEWTAGLNTAGIPAELSHHAGTYACNAVLYWSLLFGARQRHRLRSLLVHVPLAPAQAAAQGLPEPTMSVEQTSAAVRWLLAQIEALA